MTDGGVGSCPGESIGGLFFVFGGGTFGEYEFKVGKYEMCAAVGVDEGGYAGEELWNVAIGRGEN